MADTIPTDIYDQIGPAKFDDFMDDFFRHIKANKNIGGLYPDDYAELKEKYKPFMSDFLRGNIIVTKNGDPELPADRDRTLISRNDADEWVNCLRLTLNDYNVPDDSRELLLREVQQKAYEMVNAPQ
ncbi:globin domain-containing protein [Alicyclobacillus mengziensis]|uniref:Globin n=1 Tax=Alicyclobacillus mengziensis TaxID=2931921 RepID=A0A9X7VXR2_9BACL|nr:hypothetical protein [Alicyclobacillus mengziensis]QSO46589.1 hypothetical protein JZ786_19345 [Alicyclobacillus mengziensis]